MLSLILALTLSAVERAYVVDPSDGSIVRVCQPQGIMFARAQDNVYFYCARSDVIFYGDFE